MIAREDELAACSLRAAYQIDASSNLHAGEKSPDFAIKSGLDVSSRVSKVASAAYDRSVYLSERDGRRCPDLCHVEVRDQALGALAGVVRLVRRRLPVELLELRLPLLPGGISVSGGSPGKDRTPGRSRSITSSMSASAARSTTFCAAGEMLSRSIAQSPSWNFVMSLLYSSVS